MSKLFVPAFIQIPYQLLVDERVSPLDGKLYGFIYWFERLKDGKCTASNKTLAELLKVTSGAIQNSILNLEKCGYIKRLYQNKDKSQRSEIKSLIDYKKAIIDLPDHTSNDVRTLPSNDVHNNKQLNNNITLLHKVPSQEENLHKQVIEYFVGICKSDYKITPEIKGAQDGAAVKRVIKKYTFKQIKSLIDFYLDSEKVKSHGFNLSIALSQDTINKWLYEEALV